MTTEFPRAHLAPAVRAAGEIFLAFYESLEARRVAPECDRAGLETRFAGTLGQQGIGVEAAVAEFARDVLPDSMTTPHPLYLGLVNSSPLPAGPLADLLVSTLNNNNGAFHQSPAMTAAESEVVRLFCELFDWEPDRCAGMLVPGGTIANLQGLLLARARSFPSWRRDGPASVTATPVLFTSTDSHFCVVRAAQVLGIGERNVRAVPTRGRGSMDPAALAAAVAGARRDGEHPFAVVATLGSTGTGAIDPVAAIADVCAAQDLWLHVDACYGGAAALLPELRDARAGVERADSLAVDPHKWFFAPITAGLLLTRHPELERAAFDLDASYIPGDPRDAYRRGLPTSRRCSGMTVWMALRAHGLDTVRQAVAGNVALMRSLEGQLVDRGFRVLPDGELSVACARWEPDGLPAEALDELQDRIARACVATGKTWFSTTRHAGATWLRFNLVNLHTRERHIDTLAELVTAVAKSETDRLA